MERCYVIGWRPPMPSHPTSRAGLLAGVFRARSFQALKDRRAASLPRIDLQSDCSFRFLKIPSPADSGSWVSTDPGGVSLPRLWCHGLIQWSFLG